MTPFDANTDLDLSRDFKASPDKVWRAWTEPELLCQWFCPAPWRCTDAVIEPRPGGRFMTVFEGPDGERMQNEGAFLAVDPGRMLTFTDALGAGFRPRSEPFMTAIVTLEARADGTRYRAHILHADTEARERHERMGFADGWGKAAEQLDALARTL